MLHFTCDQCGCELKQNRYVAHVEIVPVFDEDMVTDSDLDTDHLDELAELISNAGDEDDLLENDHSTKSYRFDLCPECQARFARDPLGRDALRRLNFSKN